MNPTPDPDGITDDEQPLLDELAAAIGQDPLPSGLIGRAESLVTWFDVDHELVALLEDSLAEPVGVRGGIAESLSFATADGVHRIELDLADVPIVGQVLAGDVSTVQLIDANGDIQVSADVDGVGQFQLDITARGPHRLDLIVSDGPTVTTDWFVL